MGISYAKQRQIRASEEGNWQGISKMKKEKKAKGIAKDFFPYSHQIGELNKLFYASGIGKHDKSVLHILASSLVFKERKVQRLTEEKGDFPCRVVSVSVHGLRCICLLRASNFVLKIREKRVTEASSIHIDFGFSTPYFDLPFLRSGIPNKSLTPRIQWDFTPSESVTLPSIHRLRALYGRLDGPPIPSPRASPSYLS
nr:hypothetical protein [Tanacetum cinerariifolium]